METIQNLEASKVAIADRDMAASQLEERVVIESTARTQAEEHISRIQALLDSATQDVEAERQRLQGAQAAVEESEERLRTQGEEYRRLHGQLAQEKEELAAQLSQARNQLEEQEHTAQQETGLIRQFESQLDAARREIDNLNSIVESERTALDVAKAAAEEDKSERQAVEKVKAALEAATRENKTLRSLARGAETDVDALKNENARLGQMTSALEHEARALETRYRELERTSQANISELLDTLQLAEEAKADAERRAAETEAQLRDAQAQASSSLSQEAVFDLTEHVKLLEKQLDARAAENEETDEKYMEVSSCCRHFAYSHAHDDAIPGPETAEALRVLDRATQSQDCLTATRFGCRQGVCSHNHYGTDARRDDGPDQRHCTSSACFWRQKATSSDRIRPVIRDHDLRTRSRSNSCTVTIDEGESQLSTTLDTH